MTKNAGCATKIRGTGRSRKDQRPLSKMIAKERAKKPGGGLKERKGVGGLRRRGTGDQKTWLVAQDVSQRRRGLRGGGAIGKALGKRREKKRLGRGKNLLHKQLGTGTSISMGFKERRSPQEAQYQVRNFCQSGLEKEKERRATANG